MKKVSHISQAFWQGKTVLVTGHTGFKGGWLALWLHTLGANVVGYALEPPTVPSFFASTNLANIIKSVTGDIRDYDSLVRVMKEQKPEVVFHLAAQPLVRASYNTPLETFSSNIQGTANVLEAIRQISSVRAAVMITTDKVYENREWVWSYRENDTLGGHDPYSASKAASELVVASYQRSFFSHQGTTSLASVRAGNVIGGGDWAADRIIPDIIRSIQDSKSLRLRYPNAVRPWQYVLEPLSGYLLLAERLYADDGKAFAEAWNFGPKDENPPTVGELVAMINTFWQGNLLDVEYEQAPQPHETTFLRLDCSKAHRRLHWWAKLFTQDAIELTVEWYKTFVDARGKAVDMRPLSERQIQEYQRLQTT